MWITLQNALMEMSACGHQSKSRTTECIDDTGQKYVDYVAERINGDVSLWAPVITQNNRMYMSGNKKQTVKIRDQSVDLK